MDSIAEISGFEDTTAAQTTYYLQTTHLQDSPPPAIAVSRGSYNHDHMIIIAQFIIICMAIIIIGHY